MANGKRELIEDISDIRRLAGLAEAPKKAAPAANPDPKNYGAFSTNNNSPYGFAQGGSSDDTAANFFASDKRMRDAQATQSAPKPAAPAAPKPAAPKPAAPKPAAAPGGVKPVPQGGPVPMPPPRPANLGTSAAPSGGAAPEFPTARYDMPDKPTDTEKALQYPQGGPPQAKARPKGSVYAPSAAPGIDTVPQSKYRIPGSNIANPGAAPKATNSITNQPAPASGPINWDGQTGSNWKTDVKPLIGQQKDVSPTTSASVDRMPRNYKPAPPVDDNRTFMQRNMPYALGGLDAPSQIDPNISWNKVDPARPLTRSVPTDNMPVNRTTTTNVDNMPVQQFKGTNVDPGMDATNKLPISTPQSRRDVDDAQNRSDAAARLMNPRTQSVTNQGTGLMGNTPIIPAQLSPTPGRQSSLDDTLTGVRTGFRQVDTASKNNSIFPHEVIKELYDLANLGEEEEDNSPIPFKYTPSPGLPKTAMTGEKDTNPFSKPGAQSGQNSNPFSKPGAGSRMEKESVKEDNMDNRGLPHKDEWEYDREGDMAKDQLHTIVRHAEELERALGDNENLPEWVQEKMAQIKGMMMGVTDYMMTQHERGEEQRTGQEGIHGDDMEEGREINPINDSLALMKKLAGLK